VVLTPSRTQFLRALALAMAVTMIAAACSGSEETSPTTTTAPTTTTSTSEAAPTSSTSSTTPIVDTGIVVDFEVIVPDPDDTPIGIDRDVRIGVLDNGLTYYVRSNDSPGDRVELRLAVDVGSLQQDEADSGLAHFVEHMLFNGTERYPGNELDDVLQDLGLSIGPDVNAFTSFDETVYSLSVSASDSSAVEEGFDILLEWAANATIADNAVVEERGIVREERRARSESPQGEQFAVFIDAYTIDSDYFGASPIGTADAILATTADEARVFYDRWYRPDLIAVVAVGDLSIERLEAEIVERFSSLEARSDSPQRRSEVAGPVDERWVEVLLDEETAARRVSLDYWIPTWDVGTVGGERLDYIEAVLGAVISNRLNDRVDRGELDAISPSAGTFGINRERSFLGLNFGGEDLAVATEDVIGELKRIELLGVSDGELERVVAEFQGGLDQFIDSLGTRQDREFADAYVQNYLSGAEIDIAFDTFERLSGILTTLTAQDLTDHFRYLMSVSAPLLVGLGQTAEDMPTVAELEAALDRGLSVQLDEGDQPVEMTVADELMAVPDRVEPAERNNLTDIEGFELVFDNGAKALFISSQISEGGVDLLAMGDGGWSVLDETAAQLSVVATDAAQQSGLGELDSVELSLFLDGSVASIRPFIDEVEEGFVGSAAVDDVELLFQLLHLSITSPRIDDAAFRSAIEHAETSARSAATTPQTLSVIELFDARYGESGYPRVLTNGDLLDSFTAAEALNVYRERLGSVDDLVVAVVGDLDGDVVEELFERYVGSLPSGEAGSFVDLWPSPPSEIVALSVTAGSDDAGAGVDFLFTAEVDVNERTTLTAMILERIVNARLFDVVREELGASYGARVFTSPETRPDEVVEFYVLASGDPERLDLITETILEAVQDLASNGPSRSEFDRAQGILLSDFELVSNFDLMTMLIDTGRSGSTNPFTRGEAFRTIENITRDEVADLAAVLFPDDRWIQVTRTPQ